MQEEKNEGVVSAEKPGPESGEAQLRAELERVRARGKFFKTIALALAGVLLIVFALAYMGYRKLMQSKALLESVAQGFVPLGAMSGAGNAAPGLLRAMSKAGAEADGSSSLGMLTVGAGSGLLPENSGPQPDSGQSREQQKMAHAEKIMLALNKYADRPLVKDFLADLEKDPGYAKAKKTRKGGNPIEIIVGMQKSPGLRSLIVKYSKRPGFMQLMTEVMQDPELSPLLRGAQGGGGEAPGYMPSVAPMPARQKQASGQPDSFEPEADEDITFDASALGASSPPYRSGTKPPPPVDSGQ